MRIRKILYATVAAALLVLVVATPQPALAWGGGCGSYVVRWGDTLYSIGMQYGMSVAAMRQANPNLGYWLYAGQTISIPCGGQDGYWQGSSSCNPGYGCDGYWNQGQSYGGCNTGYGCDGNNQGYNDYGQGYGNYGQGWGGHDYQGQGANYGGCNYGCGYGDGTYVVQRGDTLAKIAARFGTTWYHLCTLNGLWNPNLIFVGQVLRVR